MFRARVSIAAKKSPKVPLQKSPGVGNFTLALLRSIPLLLTRVAALADGHEQTSVTSVGHGKVTGWNRQVVEVSPGTI